MNEEKISWHFFSSCNLHSSDPDESEPDDDVENTDPTQRAPDHDEHHCEPLQPAGFTVTAGNHRIALWLWN